MDVGELFLLVSLLSVIGKPTLFPISSLISSPLLSLLPHSLNPLSLSPFLFSFHHLYFPNINPKPLLSYYFSFSSTYLSSHSLHSPHLPPPPRRLLPLPKPPIPYPFINTASTPPPSPQTVLEAKSMFRNESIM